MSGFGWNELLSLGGPPVLLMGVTAYIIIKMMPRIRKEMAAEKCPSEPVLAEVKKQARDTQMSVESLAMAVREQGQNVLQASKEHRESVADIVRLAFKKGE